MKRKEFIRIITQAQERIGECNNFSCHELNIATGRHTDENAPITRWYAMFYNSAPFDSFIGDRLDHGGIETYDELVERLLTLRIIHLELFKLAYLDSKEYLEIGE